ncbi:MAG: M14 family metallopeptidase, partial [Chthoniobacterales bacterium]
MPKQTENVSHLRAHDYAWLVKRWRTLARCEGWRMRKFADAEGFPVHVVESPQRPGPRLYLSAGIHGDEPAATEALVDWCGRRSKVLRNFNLLVFPCLNPWGLQNNNRHDAHGRDLNRGYHRRDVPVIEAQKKILQGLSFDAAVMLHEDFDAHGIYLYEIPGARPFWGEKLLASAARHVPREPRPRVEGRRCRQGLIRTRITAETLPEHPEAFFLRFGHTMRSLTFETPSEFSMTARVQAHGAMLD